MTRVFVQSYGPERDKLLEYEVNGENKLNELPRSSIETIYPDVLLNCFICNLSSRLILPVIVVLATHFIK